MWRSCHSVSHPNVTPPVASVATQTDLGFPEEGGGQEDSGVEGTPAQWQLCHRSYLVDRTTLPSSFPVEVDGGRWLTGDASHWNETEVGGTTRIYEEITLHRYNKEAKFGLTLWYQSGNDVICPSERIGCDESGTEVYIGEIDPNGIAAKDGRARLGDKIVQINGENVKSRDQVLRLLRSDLPFITLLLSRTNPACQHDDGFTDELDALESLSFDDEKEHRSVQLECIDEECDDATEDDDEAGATESESQRQDSGFGKTTDDSTRNEESSEQEAIDDGIVSPLADCSFHDRHQKSSDSFGSTDCHESDQDELPSVFQCQQFYEMLKERCNADLVSSSTLRTLHPHPPKTRPPPPPPPLPSTRDDHAMLKSPGQYRDDVAKLGRDVAALHLEDSGGGAAHPRGSVVATRKVPRMGTRIDFVRPANHPSSCVVGKTMGVVMRQYFVTQNDFDDDRTNIVSRINADDECLSSFDISQNFVNFSPPGPNINAVNGGPAGVHHGSCSGTSLTSKKTKTSQMCQTDDEGDYEVLVPLDHLFPSPSPQQAGHHQLTDNSSQASVSAGHLATKPTDGNLRAIHSCDTPSQVLSKTFPAGATGTPQCAAPAALELEWVVKRRWDGSRYITRRPVKNRVPKERERVRKVPDEDRSGQAIPDNDVHRTARSGTNADRRRHIEKNRIQRRRGKESPPAAAAAAVTRQRPVGESGDDQLTDEHQNIAQLSRRKMMKFRGRNIFDDFTTLQELLIHGSHQPRHTRSAGHHHLLSVTTV